MILWPVLSQSLFSFILTVKHIKIHLYLVSSSLTFISTIHCFSSILLFLSLSLSLTLSLSLSLTLSLSLSPTPSLPILVYDSVCLSVFILVSSLCLCLSHFTLLCIFKSVSLSHLLSSSWISFSFLSISNSFLLY